MALNKPNRPSSYSQFEKAAKQLKEKRYRANIILNKQTHRILKSVAAMEDKKISQVIESLIEKYLKERGKL